MLENQNNQEISEEKPEEIVIDEEELNFDKPDFSYIPPARHQWRQQGPYLICKSCELEHAIFIGIDKLMVGETEEGEPILKSRAELEQG
jgi:hypothetical protein